MAVKLEEIFKTVGYNITGGEEHGWQDVYPAGRFIDWEGSFSVVFNTRNQEVYEVEYFVDDSNEQFVWVRPEFRDAYQKKMEAIQYKSDFELMWCTDWGTVAREYIVQRGLPVQVDMFDDEDIEGIPV